MTNKILKPILVAVTGFLFFVFVLLTIAMIPISYLQFQDEKEESKKYDSWLSVEATVYDVNIDRHKESYRSASGKRRYITVTKYDCYYNYVIDDIRGTGSVELDSEIKTGDTLTVLVNPEDYTANEYDVLFYSDYTIGVLIARCVTLMLPFALIAFVVILPLFRYCYKFKV